MTPSEKLSDLLIQWEQLRQQGSSLTAEELCADTPDLIDELNERIRALCSMEAMMNAASLSDPAHIASPSGQVESAAFGKHAATMSTQSNYRVLRLHAKGGLGEVLVAEDQLLRREVALKVIRPKHDHDPERRHRFLNEAEITSRLEHPGIVPVHGVGQDASGRPCYTMRLIRGENLQVAAQQLHAAQTGFKDEMEFSRAVRPLIGRFVSVCKTLAYAHSQGVIHRDLKPANIMIGNYGETLVVDWGLAKQLAGAPKLGDTSLFGEPIDLALVNIDTDRSLAAEFNSPDDRLTLQGAQLGTPAYMSPEQALGESRDVGVASDVFSLGATLYVLLAGQPPFGGRNFVEVLNKVQKADFPSPRHVQRFVPRPLEAICMKAMALLPSDRYPTPLDLAADAENWLADEPVSAWSEPLTKRVSRWNKRHRVIVVSAAVATLVAAVCLGFAVAIISRANHELKLANERETIAKTKAQDSALVADVQSALAFATLRTVIDDIQKKLSDVPAAHNVRRDLLNTALDGLQKVATNLESRPDVDRETMLAHRELGEMFLQIGTGGELGETESAKKHFERSFAIAKELAAANADDAQAQRDLATAFSALGDLSRELGASDRAMEYYSESYRIRSALMAASPDDNEALRQLSLSFMRLGDLGRKSGQLEQALDFFAKALEIREKLAVAAPTDPIVLKDLQVVYNNFGQINRQIGLSQQAQAYYEKARTIGEQRVAVEPKNTDARQSLASTIVWLGDTQRQSRLYDAAKLHYENAREIREEILAADPLNVNNLGWLVIPLERLGGLCLRSGDTQQAMKYFSRENELLLTLVGIDGASVWNRRSLAVSYDFVGDTYLQSEQPQTALEQYQAAMKLRELLAEDTVNLQAQGDLATSFLKVGDALSELGRHQESLEQYERAIAAQKEVVAKAPEDAKETFDLAGMYQCLGNLHLDLNGDLNAAAAAQANFEKMHAALLPLSVADPDDSEVQVSLASAHEGLGTVAQRYEQFAIAIDQFSSALMLLRTLDMNRQLDAVEQARIPRLEKTILECKLLQAETLVTETPTET